MGRTADCAIVRTTPSVRLGFLGPFGIVVEQALNPGLANGAATLQV